MKRKIGKRATRGETLVETIVAILILSLVSAAFGTMVITATKMNKDVHKHDTDVYTAIDQVTNTPTISGGTVLVTIAGTDHTVNVQYAKSSGRDAEGVEGVGTLVQYEYIG